MEVRGRADETIIQIGEPAGDHVSIRVAGRMHPGERDYWDGNWLVSPIEIAVGGFRAKVQAGLRVDELVRFREGLEGLASSLPGEAELESMEGWIELRVSIDGRGRLRVTGKVLDRPGVGNALTFGVEGLDQSHLPAIISALRAAEARFPVVGHP